MWDLATIIAQNKEGPTKLKPGIRIKDKPDRLAKLGGVRIGGALRQGRPCHLPDECPHDPPHLDDDRSAFEQGVVPHGTEEQEHRLKGIKEARKR